MPGSRRPGSPSSSTAGRLRRQQTVYGNFVDVESGEEWWISGPKRNRTDARYSGQQPVVDDEVRAEYEAFLAGAPLPGREHG